MRTRLCLKPGQKGTKRLQAQYGDRLVRARYDEESGKRFKTVELIVEEADWRSKAKGPRGGAIVGLRVGWREAQVQNEVRRAGGRWNPSERVWEIRYDGVVELGLEDRVVAREGI